MKPVNLVLFACWLFHTMYGLLSSRQMALSHNERFVIQQIAGFITLLMVCYPTESWLYHTINGLLSNRKLALSHY